MAYIKTLLKRKEDSQLKSLIMRRRKPMGTIRDWTEHFHALKESVPVKSNSSGSTASSKNQKREQRLGT